MTDVETSLALGFEKLSVQEGQRRDLKTSQSFDSAKNFAKKKTKNGIEFKKSTSNVDSSISEENVDAEIHKLILRQARLQRNQLVKNQESRKVNVIPQAKENSTKEGPAEVNNQRDTKEEDNDHGKEQQRPKIVSMGPSGAREAAQKNQRPIVETDWAIGSKRSMDDDLPPSAYVRTDPFTSESQIPGLPTDLNSLLGKAPGVSTDSSDIRKFLKKKLEQKIEDEASLAIANSWLNDQEKSDKAVGVKPAISSTPVITPQTLIIVVPPSTTPVPALAVAPAPKGYVPIRPKPSPESTKPKLPEKIKPVAYEEGKVKGVVNSIGEQFYRRDFNGNTVLMTYVLTDKELHCKFTLERMRRDGNVARFINAANNEGKNPLWAAVDGNKPRIVRLLLQYGACPDMAVSVEMDGGNLPLHRAASDPKLYPILEILVNHDNHAALEVIDDNADTALMHAIRNHKLFGVESQDNRPAIHLLLKKGALPTLFNTKRETSVTLTVESGDPGVLEMLLAKMKVEAMKPLLNRQDRDGNSALHLAVMSPLLPAQNKLRIIDVLRRHEIDVNITNLKGQKAYQIPNDRKVRMRAGEPVVPAKPTSSQFAMSPNGIQNNLPYTISDSLPHAQANPGNLPRISPGVMQESSPIHSSDSYQQSTQQPYSPQQVYQSPVAYGVQQTYPMTQSYSSQQAYASFGQIPTPVYSSQVASPQAYSQYPCSPTDGLGSQLTTAPIMSHEVQQQSMSNMSFAMPMSNSFLSNSSPPYQQPVQQSPNYDIDFSPSIIQSNSPYGSETSSYAPTPSPGTTVEVPSPAPYSQSLMHNPMLCTASEPLHTQTTSNNPASLVGLQDTLDFSDWTEADLDILKTTDFGNTDLFGAPDDTTHNKRKTSFSNDQLELLDCLDLDSWTENQDQ